MTFFNSLPIRISLAVIGGTLHGLLSYSIIIFLDLSPDLAALLGAFVFVFYCGSRSLLLFSGIDSPYYSRGRMVEGSSLQGDLFCQTARWVGRLYHYHDIVLFVLLVVVSIAFLISLAIDGLRSQPMGNSLQHFWGALTPSFGTIFFLRCL